VPSDSIDFVDEDDTRSIPLPLEKKITHPRGSNSYKHLNEIRTADTEEGDIGFACNRSG
jgi:hypothetical protein